MYNKETKMKAGDILLFKGESWIFRLIQWATDSEYWHVAVCVSPEMNLAIETMARGGVRARDIRRIRQAYDIYRIKEGYNYDLNKVISYLVERLNKRYDYFGAFYLIILHILSKVFKSLKITANRWQKEKEYFCSELCYEAFDRGGGLDIVPQIEEADITSPGDIAKSPVVEEVGGAPS